MPKQIVHYIGTPKILNGYALLTPIDHPSELVSNTVPVRTSSIVSHNPDTGVIETMNTEYRPAQDVQVWADTEF